MEYSKPLTHLRQYVFLNTSTSIHSDGSTLFRQPARHDYSSLMASALSRVAQNRPHPSHRHAYIILTLRPPLHSTHSLLTEHSHLPASHHLNHRTLSIAHNSHPGSHLTFFIQTQQIPIPFHTQQHNKSSIHNRPTSHTNFFETTTAHHSIFIPRTQDIHSKTHNTRFLLQSAISHPTPHTQLSKLKYLANRPPTLKLLHSVSISLVFLNQTYTGTKAVSTDHTPLGYLHKHHFSDLQNPTLCYHISHTFCKTTAAGQHRLPLKLHGFTSLTSSASPQLGCPPPQIAALHNSSAIFGNSTPSQGQRCHLPAPSSSHQTLQTLPITRSEIPPKHLLHITCTTGLFPLATNTCPSEPSSTPHSLSERTHTSP